MSLQRFGGRSGITGWGQGAGTRLPRVLSSPLLLPLGDSQICRSEADCTSLVNRPAAAPGPLSIPQMLSPISFSPLSWGAEGGRGRAPLPAGAQGPQQFGLALCVLLENIYKRSLPGPAGHVCITSLLLPFLGFLFFLPSLLLFPPPGFWLFPRAAAPAAVPPKPCGGAQGRLQGQLRPRQGCEVAWLPAAV